MKNRVSERGAVGVVLLVVLAVVVLVGLSLYGYAVGIRNEALSRETHLNALYRANENELSTYVSTFYEQTGLAKVKSDKMDQLLKDALTGRYGDNGFKGGSFAAAITEAYPDTKGLDIYDKILPTVQAGREAFRNKQNLLIEQAQEYDNWRKQGIFRAWVLSGVYPSHDLNIKVGDKTVYAQEALDHLKEPVITSSAADAFEKGKMEPLKVQ